MTPLSGLGIGLSVVFGLLLLAFVAELYYLLWWKRRFNRRVEVEDDVDYSTNYGKDLCHLSCWKKPSSLIPNPNQESGREAESGEGVADLEMGASKDLLIKAFGTEESVEAELMRLHNLAGPPRFLFTILEETREDLESEDGKSRNSDSRSRKGSNLSDVMLAAAASPLASPLLSHHSYGFNPLFESSELNKFRSSSPPPRFKFLRDAEEKLLKRLMAEAERKALSKIVIQDSELDTDETLLEGSFLGFLVGKNREIYSTVHHHPLQQNSTSSAQVLPLDSSPATTNTVLRPELLDKRQHIVH